MTDAHESAEAKAPASYRLVRGALRAWLAASRRSVRVLGAGRVPDSSAIFFVCHPPDFKDALTLVAAFERQIACVVDRAQTAGRESMVESGLGMISTGAEASGWHAALRSVTAVLRAGGLVLVFDESDESAEAGRKRPAALRLACEAWAGAFPESLPVILPVHRFRPEAQGQEVLIHVGEPVRLDAGDNPDLLQQHVEAALEQVANVFALDASLLARLMREIERDLRDRLQRDWAALPGRQRKADGFRLSPFAAETLRQVNRTEPEALVALGGLSDAAREARRQCALARLRADIEIKQLSTMQRVLGWAETFAGFPVACWGALNHLGAAILLLVCGLFKRDPQPQLGPWLARGIIVLGCYAGQVALADHFFGRAVAGYYAVTLPASGAYLARYWWLIQKRTRVLVARTRSSMLETLAGKNHARFFEKLDAILAARTGGPRPAPES